MANAFGEKDELQKAAERAHLTKQVGKVIQRTINEIGSLVSPSREQSLAVTKLEEAGFWAATGIARGN